MAVDLMLSIIPAMLIIFLLIEEISFLTSASAASSHNGRTMAVLLSIADYVVKSGAAVHIGDLRYPNWIDEDELDAGFTEELRLKGGLSNLYLGTSYPQDIYQTCIYRFVVSGQDKQIKQLFVCGG
jgi:hypothetical protein